MKNSFFTFVLIALTCTQTFAQELSPYIKVGTSTENISVLSTNIQTLLTDNSFEILGSYSPANDAKLHVIVFTNQLIKNTVVNIKDRGALATAFKIGLVQTNGTTTISYTNPPYFLRAYLDNHYNTYETAFNEFTKHVQTTLSPLGNEFTPFGGSVKTKKLKDYHYKILMPYFTDPIVLNTFDSFENGLKTISDNLASHKGNTVQVYKVIHPSKKIAVFGIGLQNNGEGEPHFLPIIGEENIAAMPYEIILQNNTVTMLHGKYRLALHWPNLSMGTFMKIMSTPGNIENALEKICTPTQAQ